MFALVILLDFPFSVWQSSYHEEKIVLAWSLRLVVSPPPESWLEDPEGTC